MSFGDAQFISIMYAVVIITTAILIITISFSIIRQIQYKRNMQEIENYYKYTLQIEKSIMKCANSDMITSISFLPSLTLSEKKIWKV